MLEALKRYFGYDGFRGGQEALINGILAGKDVLGIMPTGAGKSICFQVPALMMDGIALVVSPLISLMKDQVNTLTQSGIPAAYINTSLTQGQIERALRNAVNGAYKLIYVAPERLLTPEFLAFAKSVNISMLAVDEAHCISQWGQDFRPSYTRIPDFVARLSRRPVVSAFTATATPKVRRDILTLLNLRDPQILVAGFDRKNLYLGARRPKNKYETLTAFLNEREGRSGIVYCGTRSYVETLCKRLQADGYSVSRYHAGLPDKERHDNQDDFLNDRVKIMVATNAFGMGIDKSNVSFVLHLNMPKDVESYYQEAGRAGRDGEPAECVLFYSDRDIRMNAWLLENEKESRYPNREMERRLKERSRERMREMISYSTTTGCLRGFILKYFGENPPEKCGNCDRCNNVAVTTDGVDTAKKSVTKKKTVKAKAVDRVATKKKAAATKIADKVNVVTKEKAIPAKVADKVNIVTREKIAATIAADKTMVDTKVNAVTAKVADKVVAKKKAVTPKVKIKIVAKKKMDGSANGEQKTTAVATRVKISEKKVSVTMIAERINDFLVPHKCREVNPIAINEWLVSEGYIDTINDNGKNRKIATEKGISAGIITEIRKVGVERVRVNMFNRKAQELVVEKFGKLEVVDVETIPVYDDSTTVIPDVIQQQREEQEIECEESILDEHVEFEIPVLDEHFADEEHGVDAETPPPPIETIETIEPPRTIFSVIVNALKSLGKVFSKRQ
jgi:ATP-dependent DNA helicase RecQ